MRPKQPDKSLLESALPLGVWQEAQKQAERSPLFRFRAGAAIWTPDSGLVSTGTAHLSNYALESALSVHAEHHALSRAHNVNGSEIAVVALGAASSWTHSACPCHSCARMLAGRGIARVHYAIWHKGSWHVRSESPEDLLQRAGRPQGGFARKQRIPQPAR